MKKRENALDLLRILAAYLVVTVHVCTFERKFVTGIGELNFNYHYFVFIRNIAQNAVIIFIMLSGAFVLKASSTKDFGTFYKRTWKKGSASNAARRCLPDICRCKRFGKGV